MKNKFNLLILLFIITALFASCGGGNINKVKNGVFSSYDNSITIGAALENNADLKGGKWGTVKMDGRDFVTYTVTYTVNQISALLNKNNPNLVNAESFLRNLSTKNTNSDSPLTIEELNEIRGNINNVINIRNQRPPSEDFFRDFRETYYYDNILKDEYYGPWFLSNFDSLYTGYADTSFTRLTEDTAKFFYSFIVNIGLSSIENGILPDHVLYDYRLRFHFLNPNYWDMSSSERRLETELAEKKEQELLKDIINSINILYPEYQKASANYQLALNDFEKRKNEDIEPQVIINGFEIILSFVMNLDDTFQINMIEMYSDITLNCLGNRRVRLNTENEENASTILDYIYRGSFRPASFLL